MKNKEQVLYRLRMLEAEFASMEEQDYEYGEYEAMITVLRWMVGAGNEDLPEVNIWKTTKENN